MFYHLRLGIIVAMMALMIPCFGRIHRAYNVNSWKQKKKAALEHEKLPLEELISLAMEAEMQGNEKAALKFYERICRHYQGNIVAASAYFSRGLIYEKRHQFTVAIRMFTKVAKYYPESPWFMASIEHYFRIAKKLKGGVRPRYFGKIPGLRDYDSAVKNYKLVLHYAPYSCYAPSALMEIADLHIRGKHYDLAIEVLDQLLDIYPDSVEVPNVYLKIAEIYSDLVKGDDYNQGGAIAALRYYTEFCSLFPRHDRIAFAENRMKELTESIVRSKIALGDFYFNARYNEKAAKMLYRSAIDYAPHSTGAEVAWEKIQRINDGAKPKSTPIDFLFPPYESKKNEEWIAVPEQGDDVPRQGSETELEAVNSPLQWETTPSEK
ncbi:MAG: tetratricopeptide repeat protein [Puniceicoccales bacterium]|jgi:outer membrane protein assembly factor BamD|nr:tetratricopeptide repeat protein [Puniceicoccales bacterium]